MTRVESMLSPRKLVTDGEELLTLRFRKAQIGRGFTIGVNSSVKFIIHYSLFPDTEPMRSM